MTQTADYTSSIPSQVVNIVANKVSLLDQYIIMQTGQYEYTALIKNVNTAEVTQLRFYRLSDSYSSAWQVEESVGEWEFSFWNEYYIYSNLGVGQSADLPVVSGVTAHASIIMCIALMFAIIYKGVLFPCLQRKQKRI